MLDVDTKRRIDTARDILVGKVPDPKSQVEHITIALIYKFMDDMDKESIGMGGKPKFFKGEYKKYAWSSIFDPQIGGFELVNIYGEAIQRMNQNPNIPQLFRDIFKNAYLPYRDPETLKSFLKIINDFSYDHSERLGDAFEYLLSVLGSQGEAGQFRTPRHIIDFMVEIIDPAKTETILDPACGTAGFLISSYKHIVQNNSKNHDPENDPKAFELHGANNGEITVNNKKYRGDMLTSDDKDRLAKNILGYDISPDMVRLSLVNMYLHGFSQPRIYEYDTLTSEERWNEFADVIMANPPFMSPKGGIRPHKRFSVESKRSEVLFVDYIAEHLRPQGRACVIVPEGIIFQSGTAYKNLRKMLVEKDYLVGVISLPAGVFNPYSGVKTSILYMDKSLSKKTNNILFVKIENDGFDLGAQRRKIDKNDMPEAFKIINAYKNALKNNEDPSAFIAGIIVKGSLDAESNKLCHIVPKSKIAENGDYNLSGERYRENGELRITKFEMVELGKVAEVIAGQSPESKHYNETENGTPFYQGKTEFGMMYIGKPTTWTTKITKLAETGDILMSVRAPVGPVNLATQKICIGRGLAAIRAKKINQIFLFYNLKSMQDKIKGNGGAVFDSISKTQIEEIKIPLPPLEIQNEIIEEIETYQKIIDGARQVVQNYKPRIDIDPEWKIVELREVCEIKTGKLNANAAVDDGMYPFFTCSKESFKINDYAFDCEAVLLSGNNATGNFDVKYYKGKFNAYQRTYVITIKNKYIAKLLYGLLRYILNDSLTILQQKSIGGLTRYLTLNMITSIKIPMPDTKIQQEIVNQLIEEQDLINANKQTIEIFEQKIKDRIAKVWGEKS